MQLFPQAGDFSLHGRLALALPRGLVLHGVQAGLRGLAARFEIRQGLFLPAQRAFQPVYFIHGRFLLSQRGDLLAQLHGASAGSFYICAQLPAEIALGVPLREPVRQPALLCAQRGQAGIQRGHALAQIAGLLVALRVGQGLALPGALQLPGDGVQPQAGAVQAFLARPAFLAQLGNDAALLIKIRHFSSP